MSFCQKVGKTLLRPAGVESCTRRASEPDTPDISAALEAKQRQQSLAGWHTKKMERRSVQNKTQTQQLNTQCHVYWMQVKKTDAEGHMKNKHVVNQEIAIQIFFPAGGGRCDDQGAHL